MGCRAGARIVGEGGWLAVPMCLTVAPGDCACHSGLSAHSSTCPFGTRYGFSLSDELTAAEKQAIADQAGRSLAERYWERILW